MYRETYEELSAWVEMGQAELAERLDVSLATAQWLQRDLSEVLDTVTTFEEVP